MTTTYSRFLIKDPNDPGFSPDDYSKFKFGNRQLAEAFGEQLAAGFWSQYAEQILAAEEVVLLPSPFDHIPTASWFLADYFRQFINRQLYLKGKKSLLTAKIHRNKTYSADYGNLSREERLRLIQSDTYHIDKHFLSNRTCIFIDDIKITGSHEHIIRGLIEDNAIEGNFFFLYFAELRNDTVHPRYENYLNYHFVKGHQQLIELLASGDFVFNTRVIKYILSLPETELLDLLENSTPAQQAELVDWAIGNNYHLMPEYKQHLDLVIQKNGHPALRKEQGNVNCSTIH